MQIIVGLFKGKGAGLPSEPLLGNLYAKPPSLDTWRSPFSSSISCILVYFLTWVKLHPVFCRGSPRRSISCLIAATMSSFVDLKRNTSGDLFAEYVLLLLTCAFCKSVDSCQLLCDIGVETQTLPFCHPRPTPSRTLRLPAKCSWLHVPKSSMSGKGASDLLTSQEYVNPWYQMQICGFKVFCPSFSPSLPILTPSLVFPFFVNVTKLLRLLQLTSLY